MKELSIFIDESGDFGEYSPISPYYIISMVIHNQEKDISDNFIFLENRLSNLGFPQHCLHAGPIIRREEEYAFYDLNTRQKLLKTLMAFVRQTDIRYTYICIEKKHVSDSVEIAGKLGKKLSSFIHENYDFFLSFDCVKVYYDNGQIELSRILSSVFNSLLDNVVFRRVIPSDYRLFQVADLICTMKLTEMKMDNHALSKSEQSFFQDERTLKKNYFKPLKDKLF
ncbi:MAG: DUF3800 domain-containing protein [Oscillospiraceae bacterium]|nr:DUF3800 domain-containing protein [Oscillospiraceae bacterium]